MAAPIMRSAKVLLLSSLSLSIFLRTGDFTRDHTRVLSEARHSCTVVVSAVLAGSNPTITPQCGREPHLARRFTKAKTPEAGVPSPLVSRWGEAHRRMHALEKPLGTPGEQKIKF